MNGQPQTFEGSVDGDVAATSLDALWAWHGAAFVRCAYRTLLGRAADESGLRYYSERLSDGHSRMSVLRQIGRSREARLRGAVLPGLAQAMERHRRAHWPVIGGLFRLAPGEEGDSAGERTARALAQRAEAARQRMALHWEDAGRAIDARFNAIEASVDGLRAEVDARAANLQALLSDLEGFLDNALRQQAAAHHQLRLRADLAQDALGESRRQVLDDRVRLAALERSLALLQRDLHDGIVPPEGLDSAELEALRALPASARQFQERLRRLPAGGPN